MNSIKKFLKGISGSTWAGIVLILFFAIVIDNYLGSRNVMNILKSTSALIVVSVGMTMAILLGEIDMSVGGIITISATAAGMYMQSVETVTAGTVVAAVIICCLTGFAFGVFNGYMIGIKRFNFWLVTFGSMSISFGLAKGITKGGVLSGFDKKFQWISTGSFMGISMCIIWAFLISILALLFLYKTRFGLHIYAIGDSEVCAANSGIDVRKTRFLVYALSGLMAGLASVLLLARTNSAGATVGEGYEFNAIAAVVIGGTAMEGGKGGFKGTIFGAVFISAMKNGLQLIGLSNYWQQVLLGVVIMAIILYDVINAKIRLKKSLRRVYSEG
ncbi:MAG: ABC transporter permease [Lachnospiraceae bacterium]|nr:ABC transporter permease [Lachnospiraceae bacterium]